MKKSVIIAISIVAVIAVIGVIIWIASNDGYNVVVDDQGQTHILATNRDGSFIQDEFGGVFEILKDENGNSYTKPFNLPDRVTNKSGNKIENMFIKLKVPKGWSDFSANDKLSIQHKGVCLDADEPQCQIDIRWDIMAANETLYENYRGPVRFLVETKLGFGDLKEYETTIFDLDAKAISYRNNNDGGTFYYYLVERGLAAFEITVYTCDDCFTEDEIKEVIEKAYELKDLGGVRPTAPSTEATTEENFDDVEATEKSTSTTTTTTAKQKD